MNVKRENLLRTLRTSSGSVQAAGAVFWLAILIASLVRQLAHNRAEDAAAGTTARSMHFDADHAAMRFDDSDADADADQEAR